jgi:ABC-2 type transport system permease protein
MAQIALWLAGSFNWVGFFLGTTIAPGKLLFVAAHAVSLTLETFFCIGLVVVTYQVCLRWFGRERLDALLTTTQTAMSVLIVLGSQLAPRLLMQPGNHIGVALESWWVLLLPPAWFAGIDDAMAGIHARSSWVLAGCGVLATVLALWVGFGKLAREYATGLQALNENAAPRKSQGARGKWLERMVRLAPLRWWLGDSVTRGAFVLAVAYMFRDRETKLRVFPGLAPMLVMPVMMLLPQRTNGTTVASGFMLAFAGTYLGLAPFLALSFLKYSQHWQAADIFRAAPLVGPAPFCQGARKAVFIVLTVPLFILVVVITLAMGVELSKLRLLLAGVIALPALSMVPCASGECVPFSQPTEEAKSAGRGLQMIGVMFVSMIIAGLAATADGFGFLWWFLGAEALVAAGVYAVLHHRCAKAIWPAIQ